MTIQNLRKKNRECFQAQGDRAEKSRSWALIGMFLCFMNNDKTQLSRPTRSA